MSVGFEFIASVISTIFWAFTVNERVLVESFDEDLLMYKTRSIYEAPDDADGYIYVPGELTEGEFVKVRIISEYEYDLKKYINNENRKEQSSGVLL